MSHGAGQSGDSFHLAVGEVGGEPLCFGGRTVIDVAPMQSGPMASAAGQKWHVGCAEKAGGFGIAQIFSSHHPKVSSLSSLC